MKSLVSISISSLVLLILLSLTSCSTQQGGGETSSAAPPAPPTATMEQELAAVNQAPAQLPVKYQRPSYYVGQDETEDLALQQETVLKVGARITSRGGAQPLWDIVKRLASLKGMSVSWAKDVDQNALVDVDINAKDDFNLAVNNLLAQVGYFADVEENTIYIRNKITKQYKVAMPFLSQEFTSHTGGDIIGAGGDNTGMKAEISLKAAGSPVGTPAFSTGDSGGQKVEFDAWANIETNLKVILDILETSEVETSAFEREYGSTNNYQAARSGSYQDAQAGAAASSDGRSGSNSAGKYARQASGQISEGGASSGRGTSDGQSSRQKVKTTRQVSKDGSYFIIDKPVGIITVTTTKDQHERIGKYIDSLRKAIYQQIAIEAKIIEVQLTDASSIGINWSSVLKNFGIGGTVEFGADGQVYPFTYNNDAVNSGSIYSTDLSTYTDAINPGQFVSKISLNSANFDIFLNALNEQGDTKILSNPKISVLNGQPAFITVGRNVTYVDTIDSDLDSDTGIITYSVNTERILSGVGMALTATVLDDSEVVLNLVPITSELQEPIDYMDVGSYGGTVGLPVVNIREMSTTVKVRDGEMLVIGGLISDSNQTTGEFAPVLGDIPVLRYLFGYEEKEHIKRELIILLRPRII